MQCKRWLERAEQTLNTLARLQVEEEASSHGLPCSALLPGTKVSIGSRRRERGTWQGDTGRLRTSQEARSNLTRLFQSFPCWSRTASGSILICIRLESAISSSLRRDLLERRATRAHDGKAQALVG